MKNEFVTKWIPLTLAVITVAGVVFAGGKFAEKLDTTSACTQKNEQAIIDTTKKIEAKFEKMTDNVNDLTVKVAELVVEMKLERQAREQQMQTQRATR